MLEDLKELVLAANLELCARNLVIYTWGNVSGFDHERGLVVIKPSGVPYEKLTAAQMVIVNLNGEVVEGSLRPSSDTPTHLVLYRSFPGIGGVAHTHSTWATAWAQARLSIPCYGTTHADHFHGEIPCTRGLRRAEIETAYEAETGKVIAERFRGLDPDACPGVVVANHGPFTWGQDCLKAVENSVVLEEVARMAALTRQLNPGVPPAPRFLIDKHYWRKHGAGAYYGQSGEGKES